jgi:hypothetical protein
LQERKEERKEERGGKMTRTMLDEGFLNELLPFFSDDSTY